MKIECEDKCDQCSNQYNGQCIATYVWSGNCENCPQVIKDPKPEDPEIQSKAKITITTTGINPLWICTDDRLFLGSDETKKPK